jgi:putative copper resistance protein D
MMLESIDIGVILFKLLAYFCSFMAVGSILLQLILPFSVSKTLVSRTALVAIFSYIVLLAFDAFALTGEFTGIFDIEIISLLFETPNGQAFAVRMVGLGVIVVALFFKTPTSRYSKRLLMICLTLGALITLVSFTQVGHIFNQANLLSQFILFVHVLVAALWIGILFPLKKIAYSALSVFTAKTPKTVSDNTLQSDTIPKGVTQFSLLKSIAMRFGEIASIFVPILLIAGGYMVWLLFDDLESLLGSNYGQILILKIIAVLIILIIAYQNKFKVVPELNKENQNKEKQKIEKQNSITKLIKMLNIETFLFVVILLLTSILTTIGLHY